MTLPSGGPSSVSLALIPSDGPSSLSAVIPSGGVQPSHFGPSTSSNITATANGCFGCLFSGFNYYCSIGQICVNIQPTVNQSFEKEFDNIIKDFVL